MKIYFSLKFIILFCFTTIAQEGIIWNSKSDKIKIPFELSHNLIIVDVVMNNVKMKMILDSGSDESILFSIPNNDSISLKETELVKIKGVGKNDLIEAYKASKNSLEIGKLRDFNFTIIIVPNQEIDIVNITGIPINGVLGASFFKPFLIEIDYDSKIIFLHKNNSEKLEKIKKNKNFSSVPITLENDKPYMQIPIKLDHDFKKFKLLVDTGMADGLWLFQNDSIRCEKKYFEDILGYGLSGVVHGKRSRVEEVSLSDYIIKNALVSYPDSDMFTNVIITNGRNGSIGGQFLKRFNWFFDYKNKMMYFEKNNLYDLPFEYNMSGIEIQHKESEWVKKEFSNFDTKSTSYNKEFNFSRKIVNYKYVLKPVYEIYAIRENSSGFKAGLREGDIIYKINGRKASNLKIDFFNELFISEPGKKIKIQVYRKGQLLNFEFTLEKIL